MLCGPLSTRDWDPMTITLQAHSLVKGRSRSKFAAHYAWGTSRVCECKMDVKSTWTHTWRWMDHVSWSLDHYQNPPLGGRPNTKPGDHGNPNDHNRWFIVFYHVWGTAWINIHWNSIWLRVWSHMTSHYTWGSVTTLHSCGGVLGWPLDTFI